MNTTTIILNRDGVIQPIELCADTKDHERIKPLEFLTSVEIVKDLKNRLNGETVNDLMINYENDDLISWHSSLGRWIRNTYGLWYTNNPRVNVSDSNSPIHPDQFSMSVITMFCYNNKHNILDDSNDDNQLHAYEDAMKVLG